MRKILFFIISTLFMYGEIGTVTAIRGDVKITRGIALYQANKGLDIEEGDTFFTAKRASMQITFSDNSVITLGQETVFKVQEYLYSESNVSDKAKFALHKGFFKSITGRIGKVAPKEYTIKTKNSTIGVRGTQIIGSSDDKKESIACTDGIIAVASGGKEVVAKANEAVQIKLDPRIVYTVASPIDTVVIAQVKAGIKKADDPDVRGRPTSEISASVSPQAQKELQRKGIDPQTLLEKPAVTIEAAKPIDAQTRKMLEKGFVANTKGFKSQEALKQEIAHFEKKVLKAKENNGTQASLPSPAEKIEEPPATPFLPKSTTQRDIDGANQQWKRFEEMQRTNNINNMLGRY